MLPERTSATRVSTWYRESNALALNKAMRSVQSALLRDATRLELTLWEPPTSPILQHLGIHPHVHAGHTTPIQHMSFAHSHTTRTHMRKPTPRKHSRAHSQPHMHIRYSHTHTLSASLSLFHTNFTGKLLKEYAPEPDSNRLRRLTLTQVDAEHKGEADLTRGLSTNKYLALETNPRFGARPTRLSSKIHDRAGMCARVSARCV